MMKGKQKGFLNNLKCCRKAGQSLRRIEEEFDRRQNEQNKEKF